MTVWLMPTWLLVVLAFWPLWPAFIVTYACLIVSSRHDDTWESENQLPGNLSEGRTR